MKVIDQYTDVASQAAEEAEGVSVRWLLTKEDGAPHFAMRVFDVIAGHSTPYHAHWWEHEVFVLSGQGVVCDEQGGETPLQSGSVVLVGSNERHCFRNAGDGNLRFICLIPHPELEEAIR